MKGFFRNVSSFLSVSDIIIILTVCVISLVSFTAFNSDDKGETIVIEQSGKVYGSYNMASLEDTPREIVIKSKYGENILAVDNKGAEMIYSNCLRQVDVRRGKIDAPGEIIVCAPHRLVVYITGKSNIDAITG